MADQTFTPTRARMADAPPAFETAPAPDRKLSYWATLDKPLILIVGILLAIGCGMVFSTTFDWSLQSRGSNTAIFVQDHLRNVGLGLVVLVFFSRMDYRFWRRFAPLLFIVTFAALVAVLFFGDDAFNARRSLIGGRFQPGELAEFTIVVYMAAWLSARNTRVDSIFFGLIPFGVLLAMISAPIILQPDLSSVVIIVMTAVTMYFLAGARVWHMAVAGIGALIVVVAFVQVFPYAQDRVTTYLASIEDPTRANYHIQQAIIAFVNGGWFGVGLGQGQQKFGFLPAPHTDSIFAVIGEELGVVGAGLVVLLFVAYVVRGFQIARRAADPFGSLLAIGFTMWVAIQSLLNIAVMTAVIPASGLPLPFISYGGSALFVLMVSVGLLLSVNRIAILRERASNRRRESAYYDRGWGDRRARLSRTGRRGSPAVPTRQRRT